MKNPSGKLRLIYVWEIQSLPSVQSFPDLISINRMYRDRDFELISVCIDEQSKKDSLLQFLKMQEASNSNYLVSTDNKNRITRSIHPLWQGEFPYTILVEPGGEIVYSKEGAVDPAKLKTIIVNNHLIGRYP